MLRRLPQLLAAFLLTVSFASSTVESANAAAAPGCWTVVDNVILNANTCSGVITVPDGITGIGYTAFMNSSVTSITFPTSLRTIATSAFYRVDTLTAVTFAPGLISIGDGAFAETKITSLSLPPTLTTLGVGAFYGIPTLTSISLGPGLTEIPQDAFVGVGATSIVLPPTIKSIGLRAFKGADSLTAITLPSGLETIGPDAFQNTTHLTSLTVPSSVYSIDTTSFNGGAYTVPADVITRVAATNTTRLANIATAAAEVVRQQTENARKVAEQQAAQVIASARSKISESFKAKGKVSRDDLLAASFSGISQKNIAKLQAEIDAKSGGVASIEELELLAKKVVTVESLGGDASTAKRTSTADLSAIGVTGMDSAFKTTILRKIVAQPAEARDSFAEIDALAASYLAQSQARLARTASIIEKIASRR